MQPSGQPDIPEHVCIEKPESRGCHYNAAQGDYQPLLPAEISAYQRPDKDKPSHIEGEMRCAKMYEMARDQPPVLTIFDSKPVVPKQFPGSVAKNSKRHTYHEQQTRNLPVHPTLKHLFQAVFCTFEEAHV